jgi:hypothetical protein
MIGKGSWAPKRRRMFNPFWCSTYFTHQKIRCHSKHTLTPFSLLLKYQPHFDNFGNFLGTTTVLSFALASSPIPPPPPHPRQETHWLAMGTNLSFILVFLRDLSRAETLPLQASRGFEGGDNFADSKQACSSSYILIPCFKTPFFDKEQQN